MNQIGMEGHKSIYFLPGVAVSVLMIVLGKSPVVDWEGRGIDVDWFIEADPYFLHPLYPFQIWAFFKPEKF